MALLKSSMLSIVSHDLHASPSITGPERLIVNATIKSILGNLTQAASESKSETILGVKELEYTEKTVEKLQARLEEISKLEALQFAQLLLELRALELDRDLEPRTESWSLELARRIPGKPSWML